MKYAILGAGAIGSILAGAMTRADKDVTVIARGASLDAIRARGIVVHSPADADVTIPVRAVAADDYSDEPDVAFLCVKSYSLDSIYPVLDRICGPRTMVLPILNAVNIGTRIAAGLRAPVSILEGLAYVAVVQQVPGEVTKKLDHFRIVFGPRPGEKVDARVENLRRDLVDAGIEAEVSDNMMRSSLRKFVDVSALSGAEVLYRTDAGGVREDPEAFELLTQLGQELVQIADAAGMPFDGDPVSKLLDDVRAVHSGFRTSLALDALGDGPTEVQVQFFDIYDLGRSLRLPMHAYGKVSARLGYGPALDEAAQAAG